MNGPTEVKSCNIAWPAMGCAKAAAACRTSATNRAVVAFKGYNRRTNAAFHALGTLPPNRRKAHVQRSIASFVARQGRTDPSPRLHDSGPFYGIDVDDLSLVGERAALLRLRYGQ